MDIPQDWHNIYDANSDSSSSGNSIGSSKSLSNSHYSMSTSTSDSSRSAKSSNDSEMLQDSGTTESTAEVPVVSSSRELEENFTSLLSSAGDSEPVISLQCTGCKSSSPAVANCFSCPSLLCANCVVAHQLMVAFEGHNVTNLGQADNKENNSALGNSVGNVESIKKIAKEGRKKLNELQKTVKSVDYSSSRLTSQYDKAVAEVTETYNFYMSMLAERKVEVEKELEKLYSSKQVSLSVFGQKVHEGTDKMEQLVAFIDKLVQTAGTKEVLLFQSSLENKMATLLGGLPALDLASTVQLEFISNFQAIQVGVRNQFGYIKSGSTDNSTQSSPKQPPIARPSTVAALQPTSQSSVFSQFSNSVMSGLTASVSPGSNNQLQLPSYDFQNNFMSSVFPSVSQTQNLSSSPMGLLENLSVLPLLPPTSSSAGTELLNSLSTSVSHSAFPTVSLATPVPSAPIAYPPKAQIRRQKMIYHCKFGEFGILEGQFTEPSGVAVTEDNEIIVADTNNHRIQVFDKDGNFKFQFGEVGKRDGQLLYPNRVAVVVQSGDIVVTERSPTHQVQIFTKYGQFIRKFGADILQHPRGVTTDNHGRIIVVECKVMRVVIFDMFGNVLNKFSCSRYLEFPNGVVVNDSMEIYISDNRAHCVKVFDYQGNYLRQIGGEGVSNFPIGVGLTASGEICIADNHNNFNLTVFSQAGQLLGALESKVKHAQCFDVALMKDGSIVLASKDYRLYIYRYVKIPNLSP